jgi:pyruvate dehydrogenase E1 component alpha subunit
MPQGELGTPEGRRAALRRMLLIREFEDRVVDVYADSEIPGFVHLSQGQEAVAVGSEFALEASDRVTGTHRAHGHSLAAGLSADRLMAELYGKETGYCSGRGGSMHVADPDAGMLGAQPIVGASVPMATGAALTAQVNDEGFVAMGVTGDGSVAAGQVHEAFNLAATWELPVVFLIENNLYSEGMTFDEQHNIEDLAEMAGSYGIPGEVVDGQDVEAVYEAVRTARERAATGEGPTLLEAKTYRYRGHFEGDSEPYREESEKERWRAERDPIDRFVASLRERGELDDGTLAELEEGAREEIDDAIEFARESPEPAPGDAYTEVFAEPAPEVQRFREMMAAEGSGGGE